MINKLFYYISTSLNPYENLATERYLLENVSKESCILYLWQNEKTVVIGKNQNPHAETRCNLLEEDGVFLARRLSGGGAVFHDTGNLNFTFLCSSENYNLEKQLSVISSACALAGIKTEISGRNDILSGGRKFSGNAFYNSKGKSYHHGTILIDADKALMERYLTPPKAKLQTKGIKSVKSRTVNLSSLSPSLTCEKMKEHMLSAFKEVYKIEPLEIKETDKEKISLLKEKYSSWEYLYGTSSPFSFTFEGLLSCGNVSLGLFVKDGIIKDAKLYTDSMDFSISPKIEKALLSCRFDYESLSCAFKSTLSPELAKEFLNLFKTQGI